MDVGGLPATELRRNLADLTRLNRLPGGTGASVRAISHLAGSDRRLDVVDVGTGAGDMPVAFARCGWRAFAVEPDPTIAAIARSNAAGTEDVEVIDADGRALPFDDASVDVAHASLLLHHLDPHDAVAVLREMRRVARRGVVVNDLRRGMLPLVATGVSVALLATCRTTRHDGLLSVRRAYRHAELDALLGAAGLAVARRRLGWMPRVVTTAVATTER